MKKIVFLLLLLSVSAYGAKITNVKVKVLDGFGGESSSVLARCVSKVGSEYDPATLTSDVTSLKTSGEYQDVKAEAVRVADGVELVFSVYRKVRFQSPLKVEGNKEFGESKIFTESGLKDGTLYSEGELAEAAQKVRDYYVKKHYPNARVIPVTKMIPGGNNCNVTFVVEEGALVKIKTYDFTGVENVDPSELRKAIGVLPFWDPRAWFMEKPITQDDLAQAVEKIKLYYMDLGYLDVKVSYPKYVHNSVGVVDALIFEVNEGALYKIGTQKITGVTRYSIQDVFEKSKLPAEGSVAGAKILDEAAKRISVTIGSGDLGLAESRVDIKRIPRVDDSSVVDIIYDVVEGVPVVIDRVVVEGNEYTKDKVIRREIELDPGDKMLADRAENSKKRLESLYYFSRVNYKLRDSGRGKAPDGSEYRDLVFEVDELKNTGRFNFGVGASSVDSVYVSGEVNQSNFDLFAPSKLFRGGGQKGRLYAQVGPRIQTYEAEVSEPWFMDRALELTVQAYRRQRWYDEYDVIRTGGSVSLDYPVLMWMPWKGLKHTQAFGRFGVALLAELIQLDEMEDGYWYKNGKKVSLAEPGGEDDKYGDAFEAVARFYWSRTQLDNFRTPKSGTRSRIFFDLASGDNEYWRLGFNHRNYFHLFKEYNHVLMLALRAETIDALSDEVPIYNRLFLGGPKSIRGIEYRHVSPMVSRNKDGGGDYMPWGGQTLFCLNAEYTVPIVKYLRIAVFSDMGAVGEDEFDFDFSDNFAWTAGVGFRIDIPSFPIRIDFAAPIKKPDEAEEEVFSFTIGYDF
ncbi:MAG: outer membrane protein assembly factor BamA [Kiritimatiellae bacterium]|nr:outer membrane protein assembly factor BamA [Kiritimatiellia bacterium]